MDGDRCWAGLTSFMILDFGSEGLGGAFVDSKSPPKERVCRLDPASLRRHRWNGFWNKNGTIIAFLQMYFRRKWERTAEGWIPKKTLWTGQLTFRFAIPTNCQYRYSQELQRGDVALSKFLLILRRFAPTSSSLCYFPTVFEKSQDKQDKYQVRRCGAWLAW
jgi:hypothetical protein